MDVSDDRGFEKIDEMRCGECRRYYYFKHFAVYLFQLGFKTLVINNKCYHATYMINM